MKYYSTILKKAFDTEKECVDAEARYSEEKQAEKERLEALAANRRERAHEVEDAYKAAVDARKVYQELRDKFIKDFGCFHMTWSNNSEYVDDVCNSFFRFF